MRLIVGIGEDGVLNVGKPAFDVIEPGSVGWRPDQTDVVCFCPLEDLRRLMGREVV